MVEPVPADVPADRHRVEIQRRRWLLAPIHRGECPVGERDRAEARWCRQALLGARVADVDAPPVRVHLDPPEGCHGVDQEQRAVLRAQPAQLLKGLPQSGRGLNVHGAHSLGFRELFQGGGDLVGLHRHAPLPSQDDDPRTTPGGDLAHPFSEEAAHQHDGHVVRLEDVGQGGLHGGRARARDRIGQVVGRLEDLAKHGLELVHHLEGGRIQMPDHRFCHRLEHPVADRARPRAHEEPPGWMEGLGDRPHVSSPRSGSRGAGATAERSIAGTPARPARAMVSARSSRRISRTRRTPSGPPAARPHR